MARTNRIYRLLVRHGQRIAVTLVPLVFALLHATGWLHLEVLKRLDDIVYDARLRATMPRTLDERIVVVDIDEKSLAQVGRWPWSRNRLAAMVDELFERQRIAVLGFDEVFAEPDESSGLPRLQQLAARELKDQPGFTRALAGLAPELDYDAVFARALRGRPVVMGYYFTSDREGHTSGVLPTPVMDPAALQGRTVSFTTWTGYGANFAKLAEAAPTAGFFNAISESDGVIRSVPLVAEFQGRYYESLALGLFRRLADQPAVLPGFPQDTVGDSGYTRLESLLLQQGDKVFPVPVDENVAALVPFRGYGGPAGGSFRYVSAADLLAGRLAPGALRDKIVLVGSTAPGLQDTRVTPVGEVYPGVETHANLISGLLDGRLPQRPDFSQGAEIVMLLVAGLVLAFALPVLSASRAVILSVVVIGALVVFNFWLYLDLALVLPLASAVLMSLAAFALNMSYGYFVESRSKRKLAGLFGSYVPPELVDQMVRDPDRYSMAAENRELTVMFCDMRGFTQLSEKMEPTALQGLLNEVFTRLTGLIRTHRGTIDKYMGDCVMAFWGAPVETPEHAALAARTALEMTAAVRRLNEEYQARGIPAIGVGIGLNTGTMCVGDMGSDIRLSYTVIGDAVNLGSRLEGLCKVYGVDIVASEATRAQAPGVAWLELDRVRVKGKDQAVAIFHPLGPEPALSAAQRAECDAWHAYLAAYRAQDWAACDCLAPHEPAASVTKYLYELYGQRVASRREQPYDPDWDGATSFETK